MLQLLLSIVESYICGSGNDFQKCVGLVLCVHQVKSPKAVQSERSHHSWVISVTSFTCCWRSKKSSCRSSLRRFSLQKASEVVITAWTGNGSSLLQDSERSRLNLWGTDSTVVFLKARGSVSVSDLSWSADLGLKKPFRWKSYLLRELSPLSRIKQDRTLKLLPLEPWNRVTTVKHCIKIPRTSSPTGRKKPCAKMCSNKLQLLQHLFLALA